MAADKTTKLDAPYATTADNALVLATTEKEWVFQDNQTNPASEKMKIQLVCAADWYYGSVSGQAIWLVKAGIPFEMQIANGGSIFAKAGAATPTLLVLRVPA